MKLTVTTITDLILTLDVSPYMELGNFKAVCECEVGLSAQEMFITHEGQPLVDDKNDLSSLGVKEGDVLLIQQIVPDLPNSLPQLPDMSIGISGIRLPNNPASSPATTSFSDAGTSTSTTDADTAERLRQELLNDSDQLALLKQNNPSLAEAFLSGDKDSFAHVLNSQIAEKFEKERKRIKLLNADDNDEESQKLIAEEIRQENVNSNFEAAIEYHPESFGQVAMLYIACKVNGHPVKAFIDSGAQTTIMTQKCAERCGIMRLVDKRWSGYAKGVGVQKILGRVHLSHIEINGVFLQSSFSILTHNEIEVLIGLDMLRRHQCCIDIKRNVLIIGTTGTETPFLSESDLPRKNETAEKSTELNLCQFSPGGNTDRPNKK